MKRQRRAPVVWSVLAILTLFAAATGYAQVRGAPSARADGLPVSWTASAGFTSTQGMNNWTYEYSQIPADANTPNRNFTPMTWYASDSKWHRPDPNGGWIGVDNAHPDNSYDAVRTWTAPSTGTISITGRVYKIDIGGGNGITWRVQKNDTILAQDTIAKDAWQGEYLDSQPIIGSPPDTLGRISVSAGDQIHFIVNNNGDWSNDETGFNPTITYMGTAPTDTTYYISAMGHDDTGDGSMGNPWLTVAPLNSIHYFGPGVQILFRGGDTFAGGLAISMAGGSQAVPDILGSYGTGQATLTDVPQQYTSDIVALGNSQFVTVQNLRLVATAGTGLGTKQFVSVNHGTGLKVYSTTSSGTRWQSIYLNNDYFANSRLGAWFDPAGTSVNGSATTDGFTDISVTNSTFDSTPLIGVVLFSYNQYNGGPVDQNTDVTISNNTFERIYGDPAFPSEAQAIEVLGTEGITIESNKVTDTGGYGQAVAAGGSTAIGIANARNFRIDYNEVSGTQSNSVWDGSAIDADQDVHNGEIAFNLTYDNSGPAVQVGSFDTADATGLTTASIAIHHNMSYNDVRGNMANTTQGAIRLWGHTADIQIFNNTLYVDKNGTTGYPSVISFQETSTASSSSNTSIAVRNNIFKTTGGVPMIHAIQPTDSICGGQGCAYATQISSSDQFVANLYDASGGTLTISNDDTHGNPATVSTLAAWQQDGQEMLNGQPEGVVGDAGLSSLSAPTGYLPGSPVSNFTSFDLTSISPAIMSAVDPWSTTTETAPDAPTKCDFHGCPTDTVSDIGAAHYQAP